MKIVARFYSTSGERMHEETKEVKEFTYEDYRYEMIKDDIAYRLANVIIMGVLKQIVIMYYDVRLFTRRSKEDKI